MSNVLLVGNNMVMMNEIYERLPKEYKVKKCEVSKQKLQKVLQTYIPDVVIICLDHEENGEMMLFDFFFKQNVDYKRIPLIVAGSKDDVKRFGLYVEPSTTTCIYRPLSFDKIYQAMRKSLEIYDQQEEEVAEEEIILEKPQKSILVIDDDFMMLKTIKNQLSGKYHVAVATSGAVGLNYLRKYSCNLVLLDYLMPDENGPEVLEKIRELPHGMEIPVIFLTGVSDSDLVIDCLTMLPSGYLLKPVSKEALLAKIQEVMEEV